MDIKKGQAMKIRYATVSKEGRRSNNEDFFVVMERSGMVLLLLGYRV